MAIPMKMKIKVNGVSIRSRQSWKRLTSSDGRQVCHQLKDEV